MLKRLDENKTSLKGRHLPVHIYCKRNLIIWHPAVHVVCQIGAIMTSFVYPVGLKVVVHNVFCRLEAYDRNSNFGKPVDMEPEFKMELPKIDSYKDLHGGVSIPHVTFDSVSTYLSAFNKVIDKPCKDLYDLGFINFIRSSHCDTDKVYFRSECRASMKVHVVYLIDISIDSQGIILNSQCECGAGMGPNAHCKHVCAVLYGLVKFVDSHTFTTFQTCTQQLQTFHQAQRHNSSPLKVSQLTLPFSDAIDFDPRPSGFVANEHYQHYFRNTLINSCLFYDSAIAQTIPPANPYAVLLDHNYLHPAELDPLEQQLQTFRVTEISHAETSEIQGNTVGQANNLQWKLERQKRLTASNFGQICKLTDRANPVKLAHSFLNIKDINTEAINYGRVNESLAVAKYEASTGLKTRACGLFVCHSHPYLSASPDRVVSNELLLEVKCPFSAREMMISPQTVPYLRDVDGEITLDRNHNCFYQIQGQLLCTGASAVDFVVYTKKDLCIVNILRDERFINDMLSQLSHFFNNYFRQALLDKFVAKNYFSDVLCNCVRFNDVPGCMCK